jgi:hypothetical protein
MSDDQPVPIATRPVSESSKLLRAKFYEQFAAQSEQMDKLAGQMLTVELAVPGLYAAVLKLTQGADATVAVNGWFYLTYGSWLIALLLTLISLIPRRWQVDPIVLQDDPAGRSPAISVETFFQRSALYKRNLIIAAALFFWLGIIGSLFVLF